MVHTYFCFFCLNYSFSIVLVVLSVSSPFHHRRHCKRHRTPEQDQRNPNQPRFLCRRQTDERKGGHENLNDPETENRQPNGQPSKQQQSSTTTMTTTMTTTAEAPRSYSLVVVANLLLFLFDKVSTVEARRYGRNGKHRDGPIWPALVFLGLWLFCCCIGLRNKQGETIGPNSIPKQSQNTATAMACGSSNNQNNNNNNPSDGVLNASPATYYAVMEDGEYQHTSPPNQTIGMSNTSATRKIPAVDNGCGIFLVTKRLECPTLRQPERYHSHYLPRLFHQVCQQFKAKYFHCVQ